MPTKLKVNQKVEETESGILAVKTEILKKEPFYVKEGGKGIYIVVDSNGNENRVYRSDECADPKGCAESYAQKLSSQWHS